MRAEHERDEGRDVVGVDERPQRRHRHGPLAEAALERMTFDRVFLGADAVDAELGLCEADVQQTRLKQLAARRGAAVFVLADSSKLGQRPFHAWTTLDVAWTLVTDASADPEQVAALRASGIEVVLA